MVSGFFVDDNNYTSQLNITVTSDSAGKTIMCAYDNGFNITIHLSTVVPITGLPSCMQIKQRSSSCLATTIKLQAHYYLLTMFG